MGNFNCFGKPNVQEDKNGITARGRLGMSDERETKSFKNLPQAHRTTLFRADLHRLGERDLRER